MPNARSLPAGIAAAAVAAPAWAQPGEYYGSHMGWGGWFIGPLMMLLFLAAVVVVVVALVRWIGGHTPHGGAAARPHGAAAIEVLKERFARGEIDEQEYEARRRVLDKG